MTTARLTYSQLTSLRQSLHTAITQTPGVALVVSANPLRRLWDSAAEAPVSYDQISITEGDEGVAVDVSIAVYTDHSPQTVAATVRTAITQCWRTDSPIAALAHIGVHIVSVTSPPLEHNNCGDCADSAVSTTP